MWAHQTVFKAFILLRALPLEMGQKANVVLGILKKEVNGDAFYIAHSAVTNDRQ
jgi:hypothetical protein